MSSWDANYIFKIFNNNVNVLPEFTDSMASIFNVIITQTLGLKQTRKIITIDQIRFGWVGKNPSGVGGRFTGIGGCRKTIIEGLKKLEKLGLIKSYKHGRSLKSYRVNIYTLFVATGTHKVANFSCFYDYEPVKQFLEDIKEEKKRDKSTRLTRHNILQHVLHELNAKLEEKYSTSLERQQSDIHFKNQKLFAEVLAKKNAVFNMLYATYMMYVDNSNTASFTKASKVYNSEFAVEDMQGVKKGRSGELYVFCVQLIALCSISDLSVLFSCARAMEGFDDDAFIQVEGVIIPNPKIAKYLKREEWKKVFPEGSEAYNLYEAAYTSRGELDG